MTIRERTPEDNPALLDIWHRAVQATHAFLTEYDIAELYPQVRDLYLPRVCLHTERTCVATRTAAREARDAANTGRIRKERNAASGRSRGNPKLKKPFQGNARNRPYGGVARRLFGSAKRRSSLLALRAISGIRMCVPYVNRP
ncbi:hypothetical protein [Burkholderia ubonensis]|uniref:hypothetical protein n=2 Tax=Burkholderia ubonensis TaxID=101571 RepID=UPI000A67A312|nr:hypothetical protein [Burkholderia ubonensis]